MNIRMDRLNKLLLRHVVDAIVIDEEALGDALGCLPEVARERFHRLRQEGIIKGFDVVLDESQQAPYEMLVVGVPGDQTDDDALRDLCKEPSVARVFTIAAHASIAFLVRGTTLPQLRAHSADLASRLGLQQHQAILVIKQFRDDPHAAAPWRSQETIQA